jgi:hypothetical protein
VTALVHGIAHVLGLDSANSSFYLFWSGIGGNAFLIIAAVVYNRFTCDIPGCHRLGFEQQELTGHSFCRKHDHIGKLEAASKAQKVAQGEVPTAS